MTKKVSLLMPEDFPQGRRLGSLPLGGGHLQGAAWHSQDNREWIAISSSSKGGRVLVMTYNPADLDDPEADKFVMDEYLKSYWQYDMSNYHHPGGISFARSSFGPLLAVPWWGHHQPGEVMLYPVLSPPTTLIPLPSTTGRTYKKFFATAAIEHRNYLYVAATYNGSGTKVLVWRWPSTSLKTLARSIATETYQQRVRLTIEPGAPNCLDFAVHEKELYLVGLSTRRLRYWLFKETAGIGHDMVHYYPIAEHLPDNPIHEPIRPALSKAAIFNKAAFRWGGSLKGNRAIALPRNVSEPDVDFNYFDREIVLEESPLDDCPPKETYKLQFAPLRARKPKHYL